MAPSQGAGQDRGPRAQRDGVTPVEAEAGSPLVSEGEPASTCRREGSETRPAIDGTGSLRRPQRGPAPRPRSRRKEGRGLHPGAHRSLVSMHQEPKCRRQGVRPADAPGDAKPSRRDSGTHLQCPAVKIRDAGGGAGRGAPRRDAKVAPGSSGPCSVTTVETPTFV